MIITQAHGRTDRGLVREHNEDAFLIDEALGLYAVVDGMGGAAAGEVAARIALEALGEHLRAVAQGLSGPRAETDPRELEGALRRAVEEASARVYRAAAADPRRHGMGCALTAVWIAGTRAILGHVGDSRAYLVRSGECHRLTRDHTFIQELRERGTPEAELASHPYRSVLVRAIGTQPAVVVDTATIELVASDRLILCTDGLTEYVPDEAWLAQRVGAGDRAGAVEDLIAFANASGGDDNTTALIIEAIPDPADTQLALRSARVSERNMRALGSHYLLEGLSLSQVSEVLTTSVTRSLGAGDRLLATGQQLTGLDLVLDGELAIEREGRVVHRVGVGGGIGDEALVQARVADYDVVASTASSILCLSRHGFVALCDRNPVLGVALLWRLAAQFAGASSVAAREEAGSRGATVRAS